jgi:hypothetical protein
MQIRKIWRIHIAGRDVEHICFPAIGPLPCLHQKRAQAIFADLRRNTH